MLTEIISAIQIGMEAGKIAEGIYNGEHMENVDRAIDMFSAIDWDGNFEPEVRDVLKCLEVVNNDDRLYVKVATWYLRAKCYATLGEFAKARQNISHVLNAQVDTLTLNKEYIEERKRECLDLQNEIKMVEHPELQCVEMKWQGNHHFVLPIENKFYIEGRGTVVAGRVAIGKVELGDELFVVNPSGNKYKTVCVGIELFRKLVNQAEEGDNCGILLRDVSVNSIQEGAWLQKGEPTIDKPTQEGQKNAASPMSGNNGTIITDPSSDEQEYLEMFKEYAADGEISERDRKMLDKFRSRLGISEDRARELEESFFKLQLTEDEKEYLEMYKEYAADGEISERDRKMLNKMRDRMGISEERAKEIEFIQ